MERIGIKTHVAATPEKIAFIESDGTTLTYHQLNLRINKLANAFKSLGIGSGDHVSVLLFNSGRILEVMNALGKIGAVPVGISYQFKEEELAYVVNHSDSKAIVFSDKHSELIASSKDRFHSIVRGGFIMLNSTKGQSFPGVNDFESLIEAADGTEPQGGQGHGISSSLIYTSGTTGRPKGVLKGYSKRLNVLLTVSKFFGVHGDDVELITCPLYHAAPYASAQMAVLYGNTVVFMEHFDPLETLKAIERYSVTSCFMVPTQLNRIMKLPVEELLPLNLSSLKRIVVSGAPFPYPLKRKCMDFFGEIFYEYLGSTETSLISLLCPSEQIEKEGSCGRPPPGVDILILDQNRQPVPAGEVGEIFVKSDAILDCYYKNPEATERGFYNGYFSVADVGRLDEEGFLYITDRKVDMVISGGVNIYPVEIEQCLFQHPKICDAAVIGVPDEVWGEKLVAFVKLNEGEKMTAEELQAYIKQNLAGFKCPKEVYFVKELPYNAIGKLLKRDLKKKYIEGGILRNQ